MARGSSAGLGSPLPVCCLGTDSDPVRGKSKQQPGLPRLLLSLASTSGLSLLKARFLLWLPQLCSALPQGSLSGLPGRRLTFWRTPPSQDLPLTSLGALLHKILLTFPSPLKFHAQCHSWNFSRDQQPLLLFFTSRTLPGSVRLLSFHTLPRAHSAPLTDQRTLMGSGTLAMYTRLPDVSSGEKGSLTSVSVLSF